MRYLHGYLPWRSKPPCHLPPATCHLPCLLHGCLHFWLVLCVLAGSRCKVFPWRLLDNVVCSSRDFPCRLWACGYSWLVTCPICYQAWIWSKTETICKVLQVEFLWQRVFFISAAVRWPPARPLSLGPLAHVGFYWWVPERGLGDKQVLEPNE